MIHNGNGVDSFSVKSYLIDAYKIRKGEKRIFVRELNSNFSSSQSFISAFKEEIECGKSWNHKNILRYGPLLSESSDKFSVQMEITKLVTLEDFLMDNPAFVVNTHEVNRILGEVIEAIEYLHSMGFYHLHLHPRNILLVKDSLTVKLINPLFAFLSCPKENLPQKDEYMAPELWEKPTEEIDLGKSELYSLGRFIQYLFSTSQLPYRYASIVKAMTSAELSKRPSSITDFKRKIERKRKQTLIYKVLAWGCAILLTCFFLFWITTSPLEDEIHFIKPTADSLDICDSINGDTSYTSDEQSMNRAEELSRMYLEQQQDYTKKVEDIFSKEFTKRAIPVIDKIYSRNNMNSEEAVFSHVSLQGMHELQEVQKELTKKYELDEIITSQLAVEIIEKLTRGKLDAMMNEQAKENSIRE